MWARVLVCLVCLVLLMLVTWAPTKPNQTCKPSQAKYAKWESAEPVTKHCSWYCTPTRSQTTQTKPNQNLRQNPVNACPCHSAHRAWACRIPPCSTIDFPSLLNPAGHAIHSTSYAIHGVRLNPRGIETLLSTSFMSRKCMPPISSRNRSWSRRQQGAKGRAAIRHGYPSAGCTSRPPPVWDSPPPPAVLVLTALRRPERKTLKAPFTYLNVGPTNPKPCYRALAPALILAYAGGGGAPVGKGLS